MVWWAFRPSSLCARVMTIWSAPGRCPSARMPICTASPSMQFGPDRPEARADGDGCPHILDGHLGRGAQSSTEYAREQELVEYNGVGRLIDLSASLWCEAKPQRVKRWNPDFHCSLRGKYYDGRMQEAARRQPRVVKIRITSTSSSM
ncbi:hypothetical protein BC827DRAFT_860792 [Russula dissimulans]|nr:hypothetical protein BC827DRAFT_860792 [Russula dissimulans]